MTFRFHSEARLALDTVYIYSPRSLIGGVLCQFSNSSATVFHCITVYKQPPPSLHRQHYCTTTVQVAICACSMHKCCTKKKITSAYKLQRVTTTSDGRVFALVAEMKNTTSASR